MEIKPIRNDRDHARVLAEVARLMEADLDPAGEDRLDVLSTLAEAYEKEHHPLGAPTDPITAITAHMDQTGRTQTDLAKVLGSRSRASEILNHRSALSLEMIRKLIRAWGLPAEVLVREVPIVAEGRARYGVRRAARGSKRKRRQGR